MLSAEDGHAIFPPDGKGNYGVLIFWPESNNAPDVKFPKIGICEIVRYKKAEAGWIPNMKPLNDSQLAKKKFNPRLFVSLDALDAIINGLCRIREKYLAKSPPQVAQEIVAQAVTAEEKKDFDSDLKKVFGW